MYKGGNPKKTRILLLEPTVVAAININDTTIHIGLGINIGGKMYPVNDKRRATLRNKLSEVWTLIIGKISMVPNILFYQVRPRLNEMFGCESNVAFAGLPVLVCVKFY